MVNVAMGRSEIYIERGIHAWDIAAGVIIVQEAGGLIESMDFTPFDVCNRQILAVNNETLLNEFKEKILNKSSTN